MVYAITGSVAISSYLPDFRSSKIEEIDILSSDNNAQPIINVFKNKYSRVDLGFMDFAIIDELLDDRKEVPPLDNLYTLKLSHVFWPIHHDKTIRDIIFMSRAGCKVNKDLFYKLKNHWNKVHGGKDFLSLNRNKRDFFDDYVKKEVDHDLIHEWVAKYDKPLYTNCLKDNEEVLLDWSKFKNLNHKDRIHMIREEVMAIGIERFGIPKMFDIPSGVCYNKALRIVITRLMKNKFADFIAFNLDEVASYKMTKEYLFAKERFLDVKNRG